ncbi:MAG TPA: M23 family metallopeptidase [Candidatus Limnocylindrales bacterium]|nr:M23 family metallopeptidase [Candidatus Limnocylindrales bacterium]
MLNASVGVQRAISRLRPAPSARSPRASSIHTASLEAARSVRDLVARPRRQHDDLAARRARLKAHLAAAEPIVVAAPLEIERPRAAIIRRDFLSARRRAASLTARSASAHAVVTPIRTDVRPSRADGRPAVLSRLRAHERPAVMSRLRGDRAVPAVAVAILLAATAISNAPFLAPSGPVGGPTGDGPAARVAAGGAVSGEFGNSSSGPQGGVDARGDDAFGVIDTDGPTAFDRTPRGDAISQPLGGAETTTLSTNVLEDGTILKPVAVDTTVADGKGLMRSYKVRSGDTLTGIARKFGVSMMTVWWANNLTAKDDLHVGQTLTIPPVSGVVVTVGATDTLESLAAKYGVEASSIVDANELDDPHLIIGQTLTIPGALGDGIATPAPASVRPKSTGSHSSSGGTAKPPAKYTGGAFAWPVAGGYISQYYHYGHYGLDIAADRGTRVKAAASGTVIFAGWKNNGGGYQVWIAHGSNLYTTYNHMSSVSVGRGQGVGRGQQVGRVGSTGYATGPHLHFEVWRGPIWNGGSRVNPLAYL